MGKENTQSQTTNIYNAFKKELGNICVSNQCIELLQRLFLIEHNYDNLDDLSKSVNLKISIKDNKANKILAPTSMQYIIGIHSCFENFLNSFEHLKGSPTYKSDKPDKKSMLEWTIEKSINNPSTEIEQLMYICEYYRLARNNTVHLKDKDKNNLINAKKRIVCDQSLKESIYGNLSAPNDREKINFDDQVLFSRAARSLAKKIFYESKYDWETIVNENLSLNEKQNAKYSDSYVKLVDRTVKSLSASYPAKGNRIIIESIIKTVKG